MALTVETEHLFGNLEPLVHEYGAATVMVILTFESLRRASSWRVSAHFCFSSRGAR